MSLRHTRISQIVNSQQQIIQLQFRTTIRIVADRSSSYANNRQIEGNKMCVRARACVYVCVWTGNNYLRREFIGVLTQMKWNFRLFVYTNMLNVLLVRD